jgi:small multidrug resistance pump
MRHKMKGYIFLLIAIISEVTGTTALKATEGFTKFWPSLITIFAYCVAFYFLSLTVKSIPIGVAYAIWAALGIILITGIAWVVYKQALDAPALIGLALITSGVLIINLFSKTLC